MPTTRAALRRMAQQQPAQADATPTRPSSSSLASKQQEPSNTTNVQSSSPFRSNPAASPVTRQIRQDILGSISGSGDVSSSKTPVQHGHGANHQQPPPLTARRARYERAKQRHGDKLGQPVKAAVAKAPPSLSPKLPPRSPVPTPMAKKTTSQPAATPATDAADENKSPQKPSAIEAAPMKRRNPWPAKSCIVSAKTTTPPPSLVASKPAATTMTNLSTTAAAADNTNDQMPQEVISSTSTLNDRRPARKSDVLSAKLAKRSLAQNSPIMATAATAAADSKSPVDIAATAAASIPTSRLTKKQAFESQTLLPKTKKSPVLPTTSKSLSVVTSKSPTRTPPSNDTGCLTRRNLDKRTARLLHANAFKNDIANFDLSSICSSKASVSMNSSTISVIVRKRPLFAHDELANDFDVVQMKNPRSVCILDTRLHADMRQRIIQPVAFSCHRVYDESSTSHQVYLESVRPLVQLAMSQGKPATVLMFGQTGSGKSFTCSAIEEFVAQDLFPPAAVSSNTKKATGTKVHIQVMCIEITKKCKDLLGGGNEVRLMDSGSSVQFINGTSMTVTSAEAFRCLLQKAKEARATMSTDKNDVSSRSHALFQITIRQASTNTTGVLTLVDCAGTERRNDSLYHNKERQTESVEINTSLYALKQCIRAKMSRDSPTHVPFRASNLTRALRDSLEQPDARLLVIATIAPNATDTEHSIATLKTVMDLIGGSSDADLTPPATSITMPAKAPTRSLSVSQRTGDIAPKNWTHEQLVAFLKTKRLLSPTCTVPEAMNGKTIMRMAMPQLRHAFFGNDDTDCTPKVDALFRSLRAETNRVARFEFKRRCQQMKKDTVDLPA